jgi:glycosyltransferase involved in cell wall biosynthesis
MRIVFWQNALSFHQSAHIRALAAMRGCEVTWVVQETVRPTRAALGWPVPDPGRAQVVVSPGPEAVRELAHDRPDQSAHVFSGLRGPRTVECGLAACLPTAATLGVLAERQDGRGWRGLARLLRARRDWAYLRERIGFVLAIGYGAEKWYARCGCRPERIYPYGYFMETPAPLPAVQTEPNAPARIVFIGALRHAKGVDVLLDALAQLQVWDWELGIVGAGPASASLRDHAAAQGLGHRIRIHGVLPHSQAMAVLAGSDLLVLPSRGKDGWGAVVSEALMRGVPVVCTDECGASVLLREPWRGDVVPAGSVLALREALERWLAKGRRAKQERQRVVDWSQCISGGSAATYLLGVILHARREGPRPGAPWLA